MTHERSPSLVSLLPSSPSSSPLFTDSAPEWQVLRRDRGWGSQHATWRSSGHRQLSGTCDCDANHPVAWQLPYDNALLAGTLETLRTRGVQASLTVAKQLSSHSLYLIAKPRKAQALASDAPDQVSPRRSMDEVHVLYGLRSSHSIATVRRAVLASLSVPVTAVMSSIGKLVIGQRCLRNGKTKSTRPPEGHREPKKKVGGHHTCACAHGVKVIVHNCAAGQLSFVNPEVSAKDSCQ
eukprot:4724225-Amphidinium_carterae.3